jgi:hypothetical protein
MADVPGTESNIYTRVSWFHSLAMARFVIFNSGTPDFIYEMGAIPSGETFRGLRFNSGGGARTDYAFVGAGLGSGGGVLVSFSNPSVGVGQSFESLFPGMSEAQVADSILTGDSSLTSFLTKLASIQGAVTAMGSASTSVHFSDGVFEGTSEASFSPLPEPGSAIVCLGTLGFGFLIRRRSPAAAISLS